MKSMNWTLAWAAAGLASFLVLWACSSGSVSGIQDGSPDFVVKLFENGVDPECDGNPEGCLDSKGNVLTSGGVPADIQLRFNRFEGNSILFDLVAANSIPGTLGTSCSNPTNGVWRVRFTMKFDTQMFEYIYPYPPRSELTIIDLPDNNPTTVGKAILLNPPALGKGCEAEPCVEWTDYSCSSNYDPASEVCRQPFRKQIQFCMKRSCEGQICTLPQVLTTTGCTNKLCCTDEPIVQDCQINPGPFRQKDDCDLGASEDIGGVALSGLIVQIPLRVKQVISKRDFGLKLEDGFRFIETRCDDVSYVPVSPEPTWAVTKGQIDLIP